MNLQRYDLLSLSKARERVSDVHRCGFFLGETIDRRASLLEGIYILTNDFVCTTLNP